MVMTHLMIYVKCLIFLHLHFLVLAGGTVLLNKKHKLPDEVFRKMLHIAAVFSIMPIVVPSSSWIASVMVCITFMAEAFIGTKLTNLEKNVAMKERSSGEQVRSMILLFGTYSFLIINCWGALHQKWMVILSVVAWGVGDAVAALVGKRFGKHKLRGPLIEGTKSLEGSFSMFIATFISVYLLYYDHTSLNRGWVVVVVCLGIALLSSLAELFSQKGMDTVVCPCVAMTGFMILSFITGGI